jgi:hypothetical protein
VNKVLPVPGPPGIVSVIVPVGEHPEDLADLYREYAQPFRDAGMEFEFLFVSGPGFAGLLEALHPLAASGESIRTFTVGHEAVDGVLIRSAEPHARGAILMTLPSYRRVVPSSLLALVDAVRNGADLAVAWRNPRRDGPVNRIQNRALHTLLRAMTGASIHDVACGVRALRRELLREVPLYGDLFRFFPVIAERMGYRVVEVPAGQHARDVRARIYSPAIYLRRVVDLLGLFVVLRFTQKPLRFFGWVGGVLLLIGGGLIALLFLERIRFQGTVSRPILLAALTMVILGIQAFALGLVGEIIVFLHSSRGTAYRVTEETLPPP